MQKVTWISVGIGFHGLLENGCLPVVSWFQVIPYVSPILFWCLRHSWQKGLQAQSCIVVQPLDKRGSQKQAKMKGPKRQKLLRGWQMEQEMEDPCQKGISEEELESGNPLCSRLVELWSQGKISATQAAELANLAFLSGWEILNLAKCGNFQEQAGNCNRDMVALLCKQMKTEAHPVKVTMKDPKTQRAATEEVPVLLPHVLFSKLSAFYPEAFQNIFATAECQAFWAGVEKTKDPRLTKPIAGSSGKVHMPSKTIPLFIHGDGCEFQTRDSLMTWSWGSLLSQNTSLSAHLLLTAMPKSCT